MASDIETDPVLALGLPHAGLGGSNAGGHVPSSVLLSQRSQHLLEQELPSRGPREWGMPSWEPEPPQHWAWTRANPELTIGVEVKNDRNSSILKELGWKPVSSKIILLLQLPL